MRHVWKLGSIIAVLALLVVMGLSSQNTVQAQAPATTASTTEGSPSESYVCSSSQGGCTLFARATPASAADPTNGAPNATTGSVSVGDNLFLITGDAAAIDVTIHNLDLPRVTQKVPVSGGDPVDGPDANPKEITIPAGENAIIEAVHKSSGLVDARCHIDDPAGTNANAYEAGECTAGNAYQVKAFNGNRIQITYTPDDGEFATIETVRVDNGRPSLVSNSPAPGLIVKGNTDITFSADITDSISGYDAKYTGGIFSALSNAGVLNAAAGTANNVTDEGGVRLVVAGNVVALSSSNFTKIDGGWRVSKTINSTALQAISTNVPWYFETRDRANNVQRTSGSVSGTVGATSAGGAIVDARWSGNLVNGTFLGTHVRVSKKVGANTVTSNRQTVTFSAGTITIANTVADPLFDDAVEDDSEVATNHDTDYQCRFDARDTYLANNSALDPAAANGGVNGIADNANDDLQLAACEPMPRDSYEILGTNLITIDSVAPELASATPVVTGKGYGGPGKMDIAQRNSIKVTFTDAGKTGSPAPGSGIDPATVTASAFSVSGHVIESVRTVGNRVYLTLADDLGSTERPFVDIAGSQIRDRAGNAVGAARQRAADQLGPNLTLSASTDLSNEKVTITITADEQLNATPTVYVTEAAADGTAEIGESGVGPVRQTGSMTYSYTHSSSDGGEFSVYVTAKDTGENESSTGNKTSSAAPSSFTFELDKMLNNDEQPRFSVADVDVSQTDKDGVAIPDAMKRVEQVDPLIVTVDFAAEGTTQGKEYGRDSYRTVELTSAKLSIGLPDGTTENETIDLTTGVTTPDSVKFTIPLLNPKVGTYTLTVQARDRAGNTRVGGSADLKATWSVTKPKPVNIDLAPGWNLISLPFQPANSAINSVIPATHPASIVMTFDNASQVWLFSRRDAETGNFVGDIPVMTANTAYFVRTTNFQPLRLLRPALTTAGTAAIQPPAITVVEGWNLVPIVTNTPGVTAIAADDYFGTLRSGANAGWLKALTFETLSRVWTSVAPGDTETVGPAGENPCTGKAPDADKVLDGTEPCQAAPYTERDTGDAVEASLGADNAVGGVGVNADTPADPVGADENDPNAFDGNDRVVLKAPVFVGKGYWLYATADGVLIP